MLIKKSKKLNSKILMLFLLIFAIPIISIFLPTNYIQAASDENQYKGVDISNWQGNVDVSKIKNAGYSFLIAKMTEGTTYVDKYGKQNIDNAKSNGLIAGAYHFAAFQNKDQAIEEANFFKQNCPSNVDFVALDFEQQCSGDMTDACLAFLDSVSSIAPAVIYCNPFWIDQHLNSNITKYPLWIANYAASEPKTPIWGTYAIWQYSEEGQVDGIDGAVDVDISGPDFDSILKKQPPVKTLDEKTNVDTNKTWTINFNSQLDGSTVNSKTIEVYDSNNNMVNVNVNYKAGSNEVIVTPPSSGYESGESYTIKVTNGVKSISGKALSAVTIMNFTTKALPGQQSSDTPKTSYTVTIDPGCGGYDSGAVGQNGTLEKDIDLDIGLKTGDILKQHGINVVYTRTSDQDEDLQARCDISNNSNSNLFVSIHMNSFDQNNAYGTETYYYPGSSKGQALANSIQTELVNDLGTYNRGVKTANYYVLENTNAPAALTEVAFITNDKEEKELNDPVFQTKAAQAIADGVLKYLGVA